DYAPFGVQRVLFGPGSGDGASQSVTLNVSNDALVEGSETVDLRLRNLNTTLDGQASLGNTAGAVTIADDDTAAPPIAAATPVTEQGGGQGVAVTLTTSDGAGGTATLAPGVSLSADVVDLKTGTAGAADYAPFGTQTVTFGPGSGDGDTRTVTLTP